MPQCGQVSSIIGSEFLNESSRTSGPTNDDVVARRAIARRSAARAALQFVGQRRVIEEKEPRKEPAVDLATVAQPIA